MIRRLSRRSLVLGGTGLLAACSAQNCDPMAAGFFSGIGCEASGAYAARQRAQTDQLAQARTNLYAQQAAARSAEAERITAQENLADMQARLAAVERDTAALRRRLDAARRRQGADLAAIAHAQADLDALDRDRTRAQASPTPDPAAVETIERRRAALLDAVTGM